MRAVFELAGLHLSLACLTWPTLPMSLRSVIPTGRRAARAAGPTRPGAAACTARISLSALAPGLGTGLPQRRGQFGRGLQQPGDILLAAKVRHAAVSDAREYPRWVAPRRRSRWSPGRGRNPRAVASGDRRDATRAHRRDHPPRVTCDRPPADQLPARPWHPAIGHSRTARLPLPWQPAPARPAPEPPVPITPHQRRRHDHQHSRQAPRRGLRHLPGEAVSRPRPRNGARTLLRRAL